MLQSRAADDAAFMVAAAAAAAAVVIVTRSLARSLVRGPFAFFIPSLLLSF